MSSIKIIDEEKTVLEPVSQTLCEICQKQFSNYVCPKCNLRYCSLACYKSLEHADCTETFYKESVTAEIQAQELDKNSKTNMLAMLKRLEEENNDSDHDYDDLLEKFENIDLDNAEPDTIWNLLSSEERKEFERALREGNWQKFNLPTFTPWWQAHLHKLIYEQQDLEVLPALPETIPDFTKMTKPESRSSPHLAWNLVHILMVYSYLMRHTMGDMLEDIQSTSKVLRELSANVLFSTAADCPYDSVNDVLVDIVERIIRVENRQYHQRYDLQLLLLKDVDLLLKEGLRATYDFWQVMTKMPKKKSILLATRKLYFYVGAAGYYLRETTDVLENAIKNEILRIEIEKEEFELELDAAKNAMKQFEKNSIKKIQEL